MTKPQFEQLTDEEHNQLILMSEHAVAPPLSAAARSVFEAFNSRFEWIEDGVPGPQFSAIAAALRAAADQVVPEKLESYGIRYELLRIADELENQ